MNTENLTQNNEQPIEKKKTIFSGVQPSGNLTIGNYLGAIKNWADLQDSYNCIYCVVDMHAITVRQVPAELRRRTYETLAVYIAAGLDPEKNTLFVQSHVPAHAVLAWDLNCFTMFGELNRMTQFKDKSAKNADNINAGLFTYPVLMAADILLYQTDLVPVGQDQKQHLELARDIAVRFNNTFSDTFIVPEGYIPKTGMKIMSLAEPTKKMSKSDANPNASVAILDSKDDIIRKFKRAVTDSDTVVRYAEGKGYGDFKLAVGETVADSLAPIREKFDALMKDKKYLEEVMRSGAESAQRIAAKTVSKVHRKLGYVGL